MKSCSEQIALLHEIAIMLSKSNNVEESLNEALHLMASHLGMMRGTITVISPEDKKIRISAAYGLKASERKRGEYMPGEGVTGKVIDSGTAICITNVAREPLFLNKTGSRDLTRENISFICVPIVFGGEIVGALSADQLLLDAPGLEEELRLLRIIAAMLAPAAYEGQSGLRETESAQMKTYGFIGNSQRMKQIYSQIAQVAPAQASVFLQGESGTGKELAARAIHMASNRKNGPFISLNCAALPENLIESELFGHEKGAFTGAAQTRKGRFELADGGTLFLDEIGELSLLVQAKLLRVLQDHSFERLGGMHTLHVNTRVIAATNRNLEEMVAKGSFRRDLFYRLNVFPIYLPPLRERIEDIPRLAEYFLRQEVQSTGHKQPRISMACMDMLQRYNWPGNIRELQNAIQRAILLLGPGNVILPSHLPEAIRGMNNYNYAPTRNLADQCGLKEKIEEVERESIISAMEEHNGHIGKAAKNLKITERVLSLRLAHYNLHYRDFRKNAASKGKS